MKNTDIEEYMMIILMIILFIGMLVIALSPLILQYYNSLVLYLL